MVMPRKYFSDEERIAALRASQKKYYNKRRDRVIAARKAWKERNRERIRVNGLKYYYATKPERERARKIYREKFPEKHAALQTKRRVIKLKALPKWADLEKIDWFYREAARLTKETGIVHHVDHVIPLQGKNVCGLHVETNLQILTAVENISKGNRYRTR